jgi:hypothetical protein
MYFWKIFLGIIKIKLYIKLMWLLIIIIILCLIFNANLLFMNPIYHFCCFRLLILDMIALLDGIVFLLIVLGKGIGLFRLEISILILLKIRSFCAMLKLLKIFEGFYFFV